MHVTHGGRIFAAARELGCDWRDILDFSASINPLGPAPGVHQAIVDAIDRIAHYPDPYGTRLQAALADELNVEPECIFVGNGSTDLIHFVARVWNGPVTLAVPVFSEFHRAFPDAAHVGVRDPWPLEGPLVYTNPVNPDGCGVAFRERSGPTLVDESFIEFTDLRSQIGKALVLRSLTKFHAMPGLRVGALIGPADLMRSWKDRREPWQLNVLAEAAALVAIKAYANHARTREYIERERTRVSAEIESSGLGEVLPSLTNYLAIRAPAAIAAEICSAMLEERILIRDCSGWPGVAEGTLRIAIRTREENDRLLACWRNIACAMCVHSS